MRKSFIWMINALALMTAGTAYADETTAAAEAAAETTRVSAVNSNWIMWALVIGFLIALLVTAAWKAQLKSVHAKWEAYDYVRRDSLDLRSNNERFLYRNIQKVPIPKEQNNQGGHGGTIHFGGTMGGQGGPGGFTVGGTQSSHTGFTLGGFGGQGGSGGHGGGSGLN